MASAHPFSVPGENSSLQLFQVPVTDVSIVKSKWVDYEPVQSGTNPIEFVIKPLSDYIDINKTEWRLVIKITKNNGGDIAPGKKYTLINNALHSLTIILSYIARAPKVEHRQMSPGISVLEIAAQCPIY